MTHQRERVMYITINIPPAADIDETAQFCFDALTSWGGQFHPDDPLFNSVEVVRVHTNRRRYQLEKRAC